MGDQRHRLSAELTPEQSARLTEILPFGWQKPLFQILVNGVIELYDRGGLDAIGAIVSKGITLEQVAGMGIRNMRSITIQQLQNKIKELEKDNGSNRAA